MKKLLFTFIILSSNLTHAGIVEGRYQNGNPECEVVLSLGDFFSTNVERLILDLPESSVNHYGAILTQRLDTSLDALENDKDIYMDNAAGIGSYAAAMATIDQDGLLTGYMTQKFSPRGGALSELLKCEGMTLEK